ncbi:hypothetical protein QE109_04600 [Fusibacter bizertensis]|uniref:VOC domain-containing protein n=1 Tax=Fusibacter bizertensis TaxID=1488331 RepID=A0ABT6NAI4_9FIRM|nr:VOC family protein [Fusibacter bizertensis]MDH8677414.1 hypothetical protein [Fusibacter bizertensis]
MARITGLGGVFLKSTGEHKKLLDWYRDTLGLDVSEYGINFLYPNQFTLITYDDRENAKTTLNFTVDNLEEFMETLVNKSVKVIQEIKTYEYGRFAQIEDVLGNVVELWEPYEEAYKEMVNKELEASSTEIP